MFKWINRFLSKPDPIDIVLETSIENASNEDLIKVLKKGTINFQFGNRIVAELLSRLVKKV